MSKNWIEMNASSRLVADAQVHYACWLTLMRQRCFK